jgi:abortive infection bacteriophage resistance protein
MLQEVVELYEFDCWLRLLVMQAFDQIEVAAGAAITYHVSHDLGPFGHADSSNFDSRYNHHESWR